MLLEFCSISANFTPLFWLDEVEVLEDVDDSVYAWQAKAVVEPKKILTARSWVVYKGNLELFRFGISFYPRHDLIWIWHTIGERVH